MATQMPADMDEATAAKIALTGKRAERWQLAALSLVRLLRDPDDTHQVFLLGLAANRRKFPQLLARFALDDDGARLLRDQPSIDSRSVDFDELRKLPEDTLGGAYVRYLDRNKLDPDLFQAPPGLPDIPRFISQRIRQVHDIWHVLTGYAPDVPGEVALQAFTYAQTHMPSAALIAVFGSLRWALSKPEIVPMAIAGYRRGKRAAWLPTKRLEDRWTEKVSVVRAELGITPT